jgi:hypothetical protein
MNDYVTKTRAPGLPIRGCKHSLRHNAPAISFEGATVLRSRIAGAPVPLPW